MLNENLSVNEQGRLTLNGMDTVELAKEYKTPLYLMDENLIRKNMAMYRDSIEKFYGGNGLVCYASKAFSCRHIYEVARDEKIGVDVVSMGELYTALLAGTNPEMICYHGNNKTEDELRYALTERVGRIVCDGFGELDLLDRLACELNCKPKVLLRIGPGIDAHTHEFIRTGGIDSKFGFAIQTGDAMKAAKLAASKSNLNFCGIHCHIGSQIFELEPFAHAAEIMFDFILQIKQELGITLTDLNLGGGFGIKYTSADDPIEYPKYMEKISEILKSISAKNNFPLPFIIIEPGRSIVGEAGVTLYTVGSIKEIENVRNYVAIDGGMTDNIRYALYGSDYEFIVANKADKPKDYKACIAGRCCESGDMLAKDTSIQRCERGDILAVLSTGAYNYSMSSNYNRIMKPPVVMLYNGKASVAVKRETLEDLVRNDL